MKDEHVESELLLVTKVTDYDIFNNKIVLEYCKNKISRGIVTDASLCNGISIENTQIEAISNKGNKYIILVDSIYTTYNGKIDKVLRENKIINKLEITVNAKMICKQNVYRHFSYTPSNKEYIIYQNNACCNIWANKNELLKHIEINDFSIDNYEDDLIQGRLKLHATYTGEKQDSYSIVSDLHDVLYVFYGIDARIYYQMDYEIIVAGYSDSVSNTNSEYRVCFDGIFSYEFISYMITNGYQSIKCDTQILRNIRKMLIDYRQSHIGSEMINYAILNQGVQYNKSICDNLCKMYNVDRYKYKLNGSEYTRLKCSGINDKWSSIYSFGIHCNLYFIEAIPSIIECRNAAIHSTNTDTFSIRDEYIRIMIYYMYMESMFNNCDINTFEFIAHNLYRV